MYIHILLLGNTAHMSYRILTPDKHKALNQGDGPPFKTGI